MYILGINAFHADASACLVLDGELIAAAEEERFRRIKHWAGFPSEAIRWCLESNDISLADINFVAINQDSSANFLSKAIYTLKRRPSPALVLEKLRTRRHRVSIDMHLRDCFPGEKFTGEVVAVEHHLAHLASAWYPSGFEEAWAVSVDGFGDFASGAWAWCDEREISVKGNVPFPHSLGVFYQAFTQLLGFSKYGDEYKVMGLAPYGKPAYLDAMGEVVLLQSDGGYRLDTSFFTHHKDNSMFQWEGGSPVIGPMFSEKMIERFGPVRLETDSLLQHHMDLAHSVQAMYERAFFHLLNYLHVSRPCPALVISGGCGMNSVANGKISQQTPFERIYIQPAAGDAGGAVGAALTAGVERNQPSRTRTANAYLGPVFSNDDVALLLEAHEEELESLQITRFQGSNSLCESVVEDIADGKVVGWFHGAMEWGPRALGHRSILGDPRREDMKDILNLKIKRRESFRPFAPSVLREAVNDWFEQDDDVPFMMKVFQIRLEKRALIPAVTHADGSGRLQTVTCEDNGRYYDLIRAFFNLTGVPMLLNTSFNENEPIVCQPAEALDCFLRTNMDVLVLEDFVIRRS